ncbi:MAG: hypothetical protein ABI862_13510 [Ilumatobacteraceae bacterium]
MHNGNWNDMGGGNWWWIPMMIMMVAIVGGLTWVAVSVARRPNHGLYSVAPGLAGQTAVQAPTAVPTAQEILAERLARGEIEPDDYRKRLDALNNRTDI